MDTLHFSWADSLQAAVSSCLCCFHSSDSEDRDASAQPRNALQQTAPPPRARSDELEGLLTDVDDAETMSLHSNPGDHRRRKRKRQRKGIKLFGFDLFGRPPIQLPESDDDSGGLGRRARTISRSSSSTLDSDAAPLDAATLDEQAVARLAAATAAAQEEQRRAKEERRKLRRERKELKRMAIAMAMGMHPEDRGDFEGFPDAGSAQGYPDGPFPGLDGPTSATSSPFTEEFGPFEQGDLDVLEDDADGPDFGAESYTRRAAAGASSGGGSDSRSRTSASNSNADMSRQYNHHYLSQPPAQSPSLLPSPTFAPGADTPKRKKHRAAKSISASSSKQSELYSQSTASQSPSLQSPPAEAMLDHIDIDAPEFEGFPGGTLDLARGQAKAHENVVEVPAEFPSVGLRGVQRRKSDMGVFLARRGDD